MSNDSTLLGDEIDTHKANLATWAESVKSLPVTESKKGVHDRFVRDCETLVADLDKTEAPSSADLCDFGDTANSLEIRYHQLTDNTQ